MERDFNARAARKPAISQKVLNSFKGWKKVRALPVTPIHEPFSRPGSTITAQNTSKR